MVKSIVIFCGSSMGSQPAYAAAAETLGTLMAERQLRLIYGGGRAGLMGKVADAVLNNGGEVTGVIPCFLNTVERKHNALTQQIEVETMHERKALLYELADAAIALPGGFGTMDEFFEIITWNQLTLHHKKVGLLNINGFYNHLYAHIQKMQEEQFLYSPIDQFVAISNNVAFLLDKMVG